MKDFETVYEEQKHAVSLKVEAGYSPQVVVEALGDEEHRIPLADFLRDVKARVSPSVWERLMEDVEA